MSQLPIDLEGERIQLDGAWMTGEELSNRITQMIAAKDFKITRLSDALESLASAVAGARNISMRLTADQYAKIEAAGLKLGKSPDAFARDLLFQVLSSAPAAPAAAAPPAPVSPPPVVAPPVVGAAEAPGEEAAVLMQPKRPSNVSVPPVMTPVATPTLQAAAAPQSSVVVDLGGAEAPKQGGGDGRRWFNRS